MKTDFNKITFDNDSHTYMYGSQQLISVTTVKKRLVHPFDKDAVSKMVANKEGKSQEEILNLWDKKGKIARDKGTKLHTYIEDMVIGKVDPVQRMINDRIPEMDAFDVAWGLLRNKLDAKLVHKEWTIGDSEWGIAGRVDAILELSNNGKRKHVFDWKSGKFDTSNQFSRLLKPLQTYDACKLNEYSIQLSIYRLIIEKNLNEDIGDGYLLHLRDDGGYQLYKARDFRKELKIWLDNGNAKFDPENDNKITNIISSLSPINSDFLYKSSPNIIGMFRKSLLNVLNNVNASLSDDE